MNSTQRIGRIIREITPVYNKYQQTKQQLTGSEAMAIMWEMGDILYRHINELDIAPHNLYRQIYGKSEGTDNISQRSYIPREFQGRCYRIRKMYASKSDIHNQFPSLRHFSCFREAMPFFDNKKYIFTGKKREKLLELLNSNRKSADIQAEVKRLKKRYIGIKNTRNQRLGDLEPNKKLFVYAYNRVQKMLKDDYQTVRDLIYLTDKEILWFSSALSALVSEDLVRPDVMESLKDKELVDPFDKLFKIVMTLFSKKTMTERNRFRRLIAPERISKLAEMLYELTDADAFSDHG